jgi:hypothetical protein
VPGDLLVPIGKREQIRPAPLPPRKDRAERATFFSGPSPPKSIWPLPSGQPCRTVSLPLQADTRTELAFLGVTFHLRLVQLPAQVADLHLLGRHRGHSIPRLGDRCRLSYPVCQAAPLPRHRRLQAQLRRNLRQRPTAVPEQDHRLALERVRELPSHLLRHRLHLCRHRSLHEVFTTTRDGQTAFPVPTQTSPPRRQPAKGEGKQ